ncbi:MAG: hypothetical protein NTY35_05345 [Planctomycetota bacterium]|nr:hypothetical protein [Planctomycetota bacterium]
MSLTLSPSALVALLCVCAPAGLAQEKISPAAVPQLESQTIRAPLLPDDATRSVLPSAPVAMAAALARPAVQHVAAPLPFPLHDVDEHGTPWVRGRTYKASFGPEGATFVPFLGERAPRNFPVRFSVTSVTSGGSAVPFASSVPARRADDIVTFARGTFEEQYVVAADSLEQRFVFDTLPSRGEIVVSIDVQSELAGRADAAGFRFENELGHVRYGRAFALDARGAKIGIESRLEDGRIELVVPEEFVAQAELPLVIDPYTSTLTVDADADSDWQADVAYDDTTNSFFVVYEDIFSATDHDVYGRQYVDQVLQGTATIDFTTNDWRNPKVANNGLANQFLCVAQVGASGSRIIRGRTILAATLGLGTQFTISGTETGDKTSPDVGGDPALTGPTYYCVVWQRTRTNGDEDVLSRLVLSNGTLFGASTFFLANADGFNDSVPSISKTNGKPPFAGQNWNVVWQREATPTNDDVACARILWDGSITDSPTLLGSTSENERAPAASDPIDDHGTPRHWLVAYTIGSDLRLRVMLDTFPVATTDLLSAPFGTLGQPCVTTDGRKFPFAYTSTTGIFPNLDTDLSAGTLNYVDGQISFAESTVIASSPTLDETRPEIASSYTATLTGPWRNYVTYDVYNGTDYDVLAVIYDTPTNAGGYLYCDGTSITCPCANGNNGSLGLSGCANSVNQAGARMDVSGLWNVSQDTAALYVQGLPGTSTCLFFQGTGQTLNGSFFGDGLRCATGSIVRLGTKTAAGGIASYGYPADIPIHTKGLLSVVGGWRYYQCWYRNSAAYCTASTFNLSNAAALLWSP